MNDIFNSNKFSFLKPSDWKKIKSSIRDKNIEWIAVPFGEWLSLWEADKWIDHEKIYWITIDLKTAGLWKLISQELFIERYCTNVCPEVIAIIRTAA